MGEAVAQNVDVTEQIRQDIAGNDIVLYLKGTPEAPRCGFSGMVVKILQHHGADFRAVNVMDDPNVRQGIKDFSNWPTIPQLYIKGEFVGGCDIVREMHQTGEFAKLFKGVLGST